VKTQHLVSSRLFSSSSPPLSCAGYRRSSVLLSSVQPFRLSSRSLIYETRERPPGSSLPGPRCLGGPRAVLSRQSRARNAISMGFFWALCRSRHYTGEREREREREGALPLDSAKALLAQSIVHRNVRPQPGRGRRRRHDENDGSGWRRARRSASGIVFLRLSLPFLFFPQGGCVRLVRQKPESQEEENEARERGGRERAR